MLRPILLASLHFFKNYTPGCGCASLVGKKEKRRDPLAVAVAVAAVEAPPPLLLVCRQNHLRRGCGGGYAIGGSSHSVLPCPPSIPKPTRVQQSPSCPSTPPPLGLPGLLVAARVHRRWTGITYRIEGSPSEFQYDYTEMPKMKPSALPKLPAC